MFCPACGLESTTKTNYCKRCGESLGTGMQMVNIKPPRSHVGIMFLAVAFFGGTGFFLNLLSYHYLLRGGILNPDQAGAIFAGGLAFIGFIALLLIWQLSRAISASQKAQPVQLQERVVIREAPPAQIAAPTDPIRGSVEPASVIEHTTRQMAGAYRPPVDPEQTNL